MRYRIDSEEMTYLLGSTGLGNGQADTQNGVGAKLGLVRGTIEVDEELIDGRLVLDIEAGLNDSRAERLVHVLDSLGNTLAEPLALVTITKLASLVLAYL
jgi:hypothetical protein